MKKIAPPKQGVRNGIVPRSAQPKVQVFLFSQLTDSIVKLVQANKNPISKTINCALIRFFIIFNQLLMFTGLNLVGKILKSDHIFFVFLRQEIQN